MTPTQLKFSMLALALCLAPLGRARANFATYQDADLVLGQNNFFTADLDKATDSPERGGFYYPSNVFISTPIGKTFVSDRYNHRVLVYNTASPAAGAEPDVVLGQPNFTSNRPNRGGGVQAGGMHYPGFVHCDGSRLYVADVSNNRVMIWNNAASLTNGQAADIVLGQVSLTGSGSGTGANTLRTPWAVWSAGGKIFVSDYNNHRVLIWNSTGVITGQPADVVVGQPGFVTNSTQPVSAKDLNHPIAVFSDGHSLFVSDHGNHRVLIWDAIPTTHHAPADRVLGQADFVSNLANRTGSGSAVAADTLEHPSFAGIYGGKIFVADRYNHRVLIWSSTAPANGQAADQVIGVPNFTAHTSGPTENRFTYPFGVWSDGTRIWVADQYNHRIVSYPTVATGAADRELGHQGRFNYGSPNNGPHASGLHHPADITTDGTRFYVADRYNHRVLIFNNVDALTNGEAAQFVLGQPDFRTSGFDPVTAQSLYYPHGIASDGRRLFVADHYNHRILWWNDVSNWSNGKPADGVLGQNDFVSRTPNNPFLNKAGWLYFPSGVFSDGKRLFVADHHHHRVLVWNDVDALTNGASADVVLGQSALDVFAGPNRGGTAAANTLNQPLRVVSDGQRLYVTDWINGRVLIWNNVNTLSNGQAADVVVGNPDFTGSTCSPWPSATCVQTPYGLWSDGKRLFIGEYNSPGGRRVLIWNNIPATNGAAADVVLGAPDMTTVPSGINAKTMVHVPGLMSWRNRLFLTDLGWHRVLRHTDPQANYVNVAVSTQAPAAAEQGSTSMMYKLTLNTLAGSANWDFLRLRREGGSDADVSAVRVYADNGDGIFDTVSDSLVTASNVGFTAGQAQLAMSPAQIIGTAAKTFFVTMTLSPAATITGGNAVGLSLTVNNYYFDFSNAYVSVGALTQQPSGRVQVLDAPDTVSLSARQDVSPAVLNPGTSAALAKLTVSVNQDQAFWTKLRVERLGTAGDGAVSLRIFRDNGDGVFSAASDTALSASWAFVNGVSTVTLGAAEPAVPAGTVYFLTGDIAASAAVGSFGIRLPVGAFTLSGAPQNDALSSSNLPFSTALRSISNHPDNVLFMTGQSTAPATAFQDQRVASERLSLWTDHSDTRWTSLSLFRLGSGADSDVAAVEIWKDLGVAGAFEPGTDTLIGTAPLSGANAVVGVSTQTISTSTSSYFVVFRLSENAAPGNSVGLRVSNRTAVGVLDFNTEVNAAGYPLDSGITEIKATVDSVSVARLDLAPGSVTQGDADRVFLRLGLSVDDHGATMTGLNLRRLGDGSDAGVRAVKIFRDANGNGVWDGPGTDTQISGGSDTFSGGLANVSLTSGYSITPAVQYIFVGLDIAPLAQTGRTLGLSLDTTAAFLLSAPDQVLSTGFPHASSLSTIQDYPDVVSMAGQNLAPASVTPGQTGVALARLGFAASLSNAPLTRIRFDRTGSGQDSGLAALRLYKDADLNGAFNSVADVQIASGTFSANTTLLTFDSQLIGTSTGYFFVVGDFAAVAEAGTTHGLRLLTNAYPTVGAPNTVSSDGFPFNTAPVTVQEPPVQMLASAVSLAPGVVSQGSQNVPFLKLDVRMESFTGEWSGLSVSRLGASNDAEAQRVKLYRDENGNGVLDVGTDLFLASNTFTLASAALSFPTQLITSSTRTYFVALDLSGSAVPGHTIGARINSSASFTLAAPDVAAGTFPLDSALTLIQGTVDGLNMAPANLAPANASQGTSVIFLKIAASAASNTVTWQSLAVTKTGSLPDGFISRLHLYKDNPSAGTVGSYDASDIELALGHPVLVGGRAAVALEPAQTLGAATETYFLGADISSLATPGQTVTLSVSTTSDVSVGSPDFVVNANFPMTSSPVTVLDTPDTVLVTAINQAPAEVPQGAGDTAFLKLSVRTDQDRAALQSLRVDLAGTLAEAFVTRAALYRDQNGSGVLETGSDALVAAVPFVGGAATFAGLAENIIAADSNYFLAAALADGATADATVGLAVSTSAYITVTAPDVLAPLAGNGFSGLARVRDLRTPSQPVVRDGGAFTNRVLQLDISWSSTLLSGAFEEAFYAVGTSSGARDVRDWTSLSPIPGDFPITALALEDGVTYFVFIKVKSSFGKWSEVGVSDGIRVDVNKPQPPLDIAVKVEQGGYVVSWPSAQTTLSGLQGYVLEERFGLSPIWKTVSSAGAAVAAAPGAQALALTTAKTFFVFTDRAPGTYFYRVKSLNGAGTPSDPSRTARVNYLIGQLPGA
ncbi:MAG: hypothetical protein ACT4O3_08815, partial [Elusimicrobiota bacterium]